MDTTRTFQTSTAAEDRRGRRLVGVTALLLVAAVGLFACASDSSDSAGADKAKTARTATAPVDATDLVDAETIETTDTTVAAPPAPTPAPPSNGGGTPPPAPPTGPAPVIYSFLTPDDIDCHNGDFQEFTATWNTDGVKVTISIDGPGVYQEHGPNGETDLPFNCSSAHTFVLTAHGADGQTTSQSVTLQPRNAQTPMDEEEL